MTVHVPEEALVSAVLHLHGTRRAQREQAAVHLKADVLPSAECSPDTAQRETHLLLWKPEARGDLLAVLVQPLRRDEQLDTRAARVGQGQRRFEAEERLILHPDRVLTLDDHVAAGVRVAEDHSLVAQDVAVGVDRIVVPRDRAFGIGERREYLVGHDDRVEARRQVSG